MAERFSEWVWEDPDRAARLARRYNDLFNSVVLRSYDDADPALPGLADGWTPRPHQKAAVARILSEPAVLLAHEVGAGKTAEMVMGAMELRRTGLARKPAIVIPNHMLEQFSREFLEIYPQARILTASSEDLQGDKRREFVARAATGDWDAVILTQKAFEKIDMRPEAQEAYMNAELDMLREQIARAKEREGKSLLLKDMERKLAAAEEKLKSKLDGVKDEGAVYFEQTGIDYLMVDEAHHFKNLRTASAIEGAAIDGSNRASDLHMKLHYLRSTSTSGRVVTLATGTPIANSVTEAYTMQRYLRPDLLEDAGLEDFDSWAATFGEIVTEIELNPDGNGFRQKARFAKFRNVPELIRLYRIAADVKTAADLNLPTPPVRRDANGNRGETVVIPASEEQLAYIAELGRRAEKIRMGGVDPAEDNMLKISGDGKRAALDMRLIDPGAGGEGGKIDVASDRIAAIFHETKNHVYPVSKDNPNPHPTLGALQIVFMDQGTPQPKSSGPKLRRHEVPAGAVAAGMLMWDRGHARKVLAVRASEDGNSYTVDLATAKGSKQIQVNSWDYVDISREGEFEDAGVERWSAYDAMKEQLIARGVPAEKIRYIHEASTDQQKAKLFEDARTGKIA
ncbi:DEAD/DEAH box helicase family protein, partial (plasmid) [Actinomadura sp. ATCC 31491]